MARPVGALNKRTRAALHAAQTGELGTGGESPVDYLLRVMRDSKKADTLRIEAAKAVAPYMSPKLSAVEVSGQYDSGEELTETQLLERLQILIAEHPELIERLHAPDNRLAPTIA